MSFPRAVAFAAISWSLPSAAAAAELHAFDLPAGRLGDALVVLGRQARVSIGVSDSSLAAERVSGLRGTMTTNQALERLLHGTPARANFISRRTIRVVRIARTSTRSSSPRTARSPAPPSPIPPPEQRIAEQEIIVTASRRAVPLSSYPGSVAFIDGTDPVLLGKLSGSEALVARLPSITSTHLGPGRNKLFVRGVSDSSFNGPTQATVGQYFGELRINYNAPDPDLRLYDIDRIELLSGPQGTLYGAGSLGGILRVLPHPAVLDGFGAKGSIGLSFTAHGDTGKEGAAMVNAPIVRDKVAVRLSGYAVTEGGYIDDTLRDLENVNDVRIFGGRAALRSTLNEYWTLDTQAIGQRIRGNDAQFGETGQPPLTRRSTIRQNFKNDYVLGGLVARRDGDEFQFVSSGSIVRQQLFERFDATRAGNPPAAYDLQTNVSLLSFESRLSRQRSGAAGWVIGAALLSNNLRQNRIVDLFERSSLRNRVTNKVLEGAVYGEATLPIMGGVLALLGGRVSGARVSSSGFVINPGFPLADEPVRGSRDEFKFLPSAAISADVAKDLLLYARYQQSFRPGGLAISGEGFNGYRSDSIASVEFGGRYGAPDRGTFDASVAVVYARWNDVQADVMDIFAEPTTTNIGEAELHTLDASARWRPLPGLAIETGAVLNRSRVWNVPPAVTVGADPQLPGVAGVTARLALDYGFAGPIGSRMRLSVSGRYTGSSHLGVGDFLRRTQGDWLDSTAVLEAEAGRHALSLAVTNLFDRRSNRFAFGSPFTLDQKQFETPMRPRTITIKWELLY